MTKKIKLNTTETRAKNMCETIISNGCGSINMEWRKSNMYGHNPAILDNRGNKCCNVSGCGYCKESTALADVLRYLFFLDSNEYRKILAAGGSGVSSIIAKLETFGWKLEKTVSGSSYDVFSINKIIK